MPSIKMKTKATMFCLKEKNGLHVNRKSSMICKSPLSYKISQNGEVGDFTQSNQEAPVCDKMYAQDTRGDESNHNELSNEESTLQKQQSSVADTSTVLEPASPTCSSNMATRTPLMHDAMGFYSIEGSGTLSVPHLETEESDDSSRSSCEYQAHNVSDFDVSDMFFSGLPMENSSVLDNSIDTTLIRDYKCEESSLFCNLTEEFMVLPFLEDTIETIADLDCRSSREITLDDRDSSLYFAIHQVKSCSRDTDIISYPDLDQTECFDPQMYIRNFPDQVDEALDLLPAKLLKDKQKTKAITLVLDLDETLVHSTLEYCDDADFSFPVFFNMKEHTVYVKQRPHLHMFLERVTEMFEVVIFTASQSIYAKQLLDILDPNGKLISRRAYRESCLFSEGNYIKDLRVLGVDLAKVVIIDNCPQVFRLQVNNGIPIKSWFDDPEDSALVSLLPFLETLVDADDVRPIIAEKLGNKE